MAITWYTNRGGRTGRGPSKEPARLTPMYLTLSPDLFESLGQPQRVVVGYDADVPAIYIRPAEDHEAADGMTVSRHGDDRKYRRRRITVTEPLKRMRIHDRVPKGGIPVKEEMQPDGVVAFCIDRKALKPVA